MDYLVFSDAARSVTEGHSPYDRATYRYSPLLAILLTPNILLHPVCGKIIFAFADLIAGFMIKELISRSSNVIRGKPDRLVLSTDTCVSLWLFNPIVINVSTRGNAEALVSVAVLSTLYALQSKKFFFSGLLFGLSVHIKLYPIIYMLALLVSIRSPQKISCQPFSLDHLIDFVSNRRRWAFMTGFLLSMSLLTGISYYLYGYKFIHESLLYHVIRTDHRHNFSIYFYQMYLAQGTRAGLTLGILAFVPQLVLLLSLTYRYAADDLGTCIFLQTLAFVSLNKVCTVQYWVWYLALLPLCLARCRPLRLRSAVGLGLLWIAAVASWLLQAYRLEMLGVATWPGLVAASCLLLAAHTLLFAAIAAHTRNRLLSCCD